MVQLHWVGATYAVLGPAASLGLLGLLLGGLWLGLLLGGLGLGLLLGRLRLLLLLGGLRLRFLLGLLLLARGLRRSLLLLGRRLLGLVLGLLLASSRGFAAQLELDNVLSDRDGVLLVDEELLDGAGLGGVEGDVDLVRLNGGNLLVLLDVVANLCGMSVTGGGLEMRAAYVLTTASGCPR